MSSLSSQAGINVGMLIKGSFLELAIIKREIAIYLLVFLALAEVQERLGQQAGGLAALAGIALYFVGQACLYRSLLKPGGSRDDLLRDSVAILGQAIMIGLPVLIGINFFVLPGIALAAKWVMAPSFLVDRRSRVFAAMGESWYASDGHTVKIALALVILTAITVILASIANAALLMLGQLDVIGAVVIHFLPIVLMGLSVTAYRLVAEPDRQLGDVFA